MDGRRKRGEPVSGKLQWIESWSALWWRLWAGGFVFKIGVLRNRLDGGDCDWYYCVGEGTCGRCLSVGGFLAVYISMLTGSIEIRGKGELQ
jgi:hypothetical protein